MVAFIDAIWLYMPKTFHITVNLLLALSFLGLGIVGLVIDNSLLYI